MVEPGGVAPSCPRSARVLLAWALTAPASVAFAGACGGSGSSQAGSQETGETGETGAEIDHERDARDAADPALNEPIVIALPQLPRKFDPLDELEPWADRIADDLVFEGLVRRTHEAYPWAEPAIADHCVVDREYAVASLVCHIPRGIHFHDGSELTMDDVVYSLSYWIDPRRTWIREQHNLETLRWVEIVDGPRGSDQRDPGRWVRVAFDKREPLALEALAAIKIVPRSEHRGNPTRFATQPVGTGPMRMSSLAQDRIVLERFEDYHTPQRAAATGRIVLRAMTDGAEGLTALRRGEVHLLAEVAPVHVPVELGEPGMSGRFQAWLVSPPRYHMLLWNVASGVQASLGLREALHDALPISAIAREVHHGPGLPIAAPVDLHDPVPLDLDALEDIKPGEPVRGGLLALPSLDEDVEALIGAAAALDRLEWPLDQGIRRRPGGSLRMTLTWDARPGRPSATAQRIREAWEQIGVIVPQASASWNYLLVLLRKGEFKTALVELAGHSDEDLFHYFHSRGSANFSGVADDELDTALADYRGAPDRASRDAAKQRIAARLAELRVISMLHAPTHVMLGTRRLQGVEFVDDLPRLDRLSLTPGDIDWGEH